MPKTTPVRLRVDADQKSCERLLAETLQRRKLAESIQVVLPDGSALNATARKYISEAIAARIVAAELAAITPEELQTAMERQGVKRDAAHEQAGQLAAERTVADARELPSDAHLATTVMGYLNSSPYVQVNITPAGAPVPQPAVAPAPGPPVFELPQGDGRRPPSRAAVDAARKEHEAAVAAFHADAAAAAGPPRHENPSAEGTYPNLDTITKEN